MHAITSKHPLAILTAESYSLGITVVIFFYYMHVLNWSEAEFAGKWWIIHVIQCLQESLNYSVD